jgi:hypothetical protein
VPGNSPGRGAFALATADSPVRSLKASLPNFFVFINT